MRGLPAWVLKGSAVCLTVLAAVGSAGYVGGHVKNQSAPLRPALHPQTGVWAPADGPGQVNLAPGLRSTSSQPVTETYVS
ncbi:MAG TPA: hypothetical protein VKF14_11130 [Candidatus Dormibacteraeota bacterium]|nr:hypothetical protein [Candidatus Dormibacteraeota bacterium]